MLKDGQWVIVELQGRKFKGYILRTGPYETLVNVYVPNLKDYSPHMYGNSKVTPALLDTFENEKDLYVEAALLLKCESTFKGAFENGSTK